MIPPKNRFRSRDGLALVVVLAFIVLLTILVVSFITFTGINRVSTSSYSRSIQAQEIAQGGLQDILNDLHQEIIAGSSIPATSPSGAAPVYLPITNYTAVPARIGYTAASWGIDSTPPAASPSTLSPTLIRVSRAAANSSTYASSSFYTQIAASTGYYVNNSSSLPGGLILNRASTNTSGTATPSVNGRYISTARWNKTFLLATNAAAVPTPFTNAPPDWVYVTRTGSRVCNVATDTIGKLVPSNNLTNSYGSVTAGVNPPASPIVGRYAFVVYDEGALIDINAAGYLATATNNTTATPSYTNIIAGGITNNIQTLSGKSYLAYADLTQLPGLTNYTSGLVFPGQLAVDAFVKWRNAGGLAGGTSGSAYLGVTTTNAANGFLGFTNSGTTYDSPLVSRQDLINYFTSIDANINTTTATYSKALPYLGTFSREMNAPTYFPPADAASIAGYTNNAIKSTVPDLLSVLPTYRTSMESTTDAAGNPNANRDLANVRFASATSITHYNDDASTSSYNVSAGDPLLRKRFSLARISWLAQTWAGQSDPGTDNSGYATSVYPAAIKSCFGLVWDYPSGYSGTMANGGNKCWNYIGSGTAMTSASSLKLTTAGVTIETLDQVAAENREPNFFEVLKAAILYGSLGKSPGTAAYSNGTSATKYGNQSSGPLMYGAAGLFCYSFDGHWAANTTPNYSAPASIPDCQVIQIGANIISQVSADSYPTAIYFRYAIPSGAVLAGNFDAVNTGATPNGDSMTPIYGPVDMFYGDENLPYIHRMYQVTCSTNLPGSNGVPGNNNPTDATDYSTNSVAYHQWLGGTMTFSGWMQPELWNPHQQPATPLFATGSQKYQMRAYGAVQMEWLMLTNAMTYPVSWYSDNSASTVSPGATINFTDSTNTSSFYGRPFLLTSDSIPAYGAATVSFPTNGPPGTLTNVVANVAQTNYPDYGLAADANLYHFVAFWGGTSVPPAPSAPPYTNLAPQYYYFTPSSTQAGKDDIYPINLIGTGTKPLNCNTFSLGWVDSLGSYHPYSYLAGAFPYWYGTLNAPGSDENGSGNAGKGNADSYCQVDPRTSRFSTIVQAWSGGSAIPNTTMFPNNSGFASSKNGKGTVAPYTSNTQTVPYACMPNGGTPSSMPSPPATGSGFWPENNQSAAPQDWLFNSPSLDYLAGELSSATYPITYYSDPDGVIRPGDGVMANEATGDGETLFTSAGASTKVAAGDKIASGDNPGNASNGRRPVILNRPFRNVGELGYTFRDLPFKTLDFFSTASADAGLLDVFSVTDEPTVVAGRLSLSNAPNPVIQAVLAQGSKKDFDPSYNMGAETLSSATNVATAISYHLQPTVAGFGPLLNRAGLVTQLGIPMPLAARTATTANPTTNQAPIWAALNADNLSADTGNKAYMEAPVRALADVTNTRTWNLMIDVIAQSGHLAPTATSLDNFVVEGEKRYWLHIAIDRYTGKIVDQQLEPVYE